MKWNLSLPERPILVYYYTKLTGLAPFTIKKDGFHPPTLLDKLYTIALAAIYFLVAKSTITQMLVKFDTVKMSQFTRIGTSIQNLSSYPTTFLTLMIFLLMNTQILYIMNKLYDIGDEFKSFGIEEDHEKLFKNLFVTIVTRNAVVIAIFVTLCYIDDNFPILFSIKSTIDAWLYLNVVLIFTQMLDFIRQRFKLVNEKFYNIFRLPGSRRSLNHLQLFVVSRNLRDDNQPGIEDLTNLQRIQKIEYLHLELCDLLYRITNIFAIPILSKTIEYSTTLVLQCFWVYSVSRISNQFSNTTNNTSFVVTIICPIVRIIITISHLFAVANASVKTCEEGNAMKAVLYKVWYKLKPQELQDEVCWLMSIKCVRLLTENGSTINQRIPGEHDLLTMECVLHKISFWNSEYDVRYCLLQFVMFSLQLMQKPVTVSIFGYFNLDYSYVYQTLGFVVAYVIILIQFDTSQ